MLMMELLVDCDRQQRVVEEQERDLARQLLHIQAMIQACEETDVDDSVISDTAKAVVLLVQATVELDACARQIQSIRARAVQRLNEPSNERSAN